MSDEFVYRIRSSSHIEHAYRSPYANTVVYNPAERHNRYVRSKPLLTKARSARTTNPYGNYKSPYYDPVKRREYYEAHKDHVTRPYGTGSSTKSSGKGSGGSGRSGSGKKGSSKGQSANMAKQIAKLREESSKESDAQREAAKRKIEDLKNQLSDQVKKIRGDAYEKAQSQKNQAEIRGITQGLKSKIENLQGKTDEEIGRVSKQLKDWIDNEKDALERRIAAIYASYGKKYTPRTQASKEQASAARDKDVKSRADAIYKSKTKK